MKIIHAAIEKTVSLPQNEVPFNNVLKIQAVVTFSNPQKFRNLVYRNVNVFVWFVLFLNNQSLYSQSK